MDEQQRKNESLVEQLRQTFTPLIERLTPEVEPAMVYDPTAEPARE